MALRSMWKGSVGFGMVNIPVKLYKAVDSGATVTLCNTHKECGTAVKQPSYCPKCDKQLEKTDLEKAYPLDRKKENCIPITEAEMETLPLETIHSVKVEGLVEEIPDIRYIDTVYILEPDIGGERAYALFSGALQESNKMGVAKITLGGKEHLCAIKADNSGFLQVVTLNWTTSIRDLSSLKLPSVEITDKERKMAIMLLETLDQDIDLGSYHDNYGEALLKLVEAKQQGIELPVQAAAAPRAEVSLEELLEASLLVAKEEQATPA